MEMSGQLHASDCLVSVCVFRKRILIIKKRAMILKFGIES
jgi:hypothetical protein